MDTQHISPRMLEAGVEALKRVESQNWNLGPFGDDDAVELATAVYLAMHAKLVESRGGE